MKLKNVLIVVKDIEKSRKFYHDLFDIDLVLLKIQLARVALWNNIFA